MPRCPPRRKAKEGPAGTGWTAKAGEVAGALGDGRRCWPAVGSRDDRDGHAEVVQADGKRPPWRSRAGDADGAAGGGGEVKPEMPATASLPSVG